MRKKPGNFSLLFASTQRATIQRQARNTMSMRTVLPSLEPRESQDELPEQAAEEQEVEEQLPPDPTEFPNIATYTAARKGFATPEVPPPPSDPLPMGPNNTPPQSILPKVQIPFITPPNVAPRAIEVERLKRLYRSMDIAKLLEDRGVDYPQEIEFVPNNAEFPPIFKLWDFDDDAFDPRTVEEWLALGIDDKGVMSGVPGFVFTKDCQWTPAVVMAFHEKALRWLVKFPDGKEDEWVPRMRLLFYAEDPAVFADRIANAVNERRRIESWMRFVFYVESMPIKAMPDIPAMSNTTCLFRTFFSSVHLQNGIHPRHKTGGIRCPL